MFNNNKRIVILVILIVLLFVGQLWAQTAVLGFQLGKSTYNEVKKKLPEGVKVEQDDGVSDTFYGGPSFFTTDAGYGIDGLKRVHFCFDKKQILVEVSVSLEGRRLDDIKKILTSKYRPVRSKNPKAPLLFKANCDYVYLFLPWDKDIVVDYMTAAVYQQKQLAAGQTVERKKAREQREKREHQKALEREAAKF